ncbi:SET domain-containing protein 4 isoform X2 [Chaetodon auriga]|uniref:SET domain-containing protein 4 isoform X2 n=1 Tax=Chaetodon auriga TaxID=39042 RepID=UPI004032AB85
MCPLSLCPLSLCVLCLSVSSLSVSSVALCPLSLCLLSLCPLSLCSLSLCPLSHCVLCRSASSVALCPLSLSSVPLCSLSVSSLSLCPLSLSLCPLSLPLSHCILCRSVSSVSLCLLSLCPLSLCPLSLCVLSLTVSSVSVSSVYVSSVSVSSVSVSSLCPLSLCPLSLCPLSLCPLSLCVLCLCVLCLSVSSVSVSSVYVSSVSVSSVSLRPLSLCVLCLTVSSVSVSSVYVSSVSVSSVSVSSLSVSSLCVLSLCVLCLTASSVTLCPLSLCVLCLTVSSVSVSSVSVSSLSVSSVSLCPLSVSSVSLCPLSLRPLSHCILCCSVSSVSLCPLSLCPLSLCVLSLCPLSLCPLSLCPLSLCVLSLCPLSVSSVSLCHQLQYVRLMKFLHRRGFTSELLRPALFTDTGRGLQALKTIKPGQLLISLPESCLLTTSTVLNSYLGHYVKSWKPRLSPLLALCVFLVCERHRGEASDWFPYIDTLPTTYTCPAYFTDDVMAVLPACLQRRASEQRDAVRELHGLNQDFFRWAWCSVNTRSVFMSHPSNSFLCGQDVYALAPFLDLLNHRPDVQVKAGFNHVTGCYEVGSVSGTPSHQQAFIHYGSHDSQRLLLEYGFVAPSNPHSVVYVDPDVLADVLRGDRSLDQKMKFLRDNDFLHDLSVSSEGPSWRLMMALRLLSLPQTLYHHWRAVLLGQVVCEDREGWSVQTAKTLCQRLLQDTHTALDKISLLLLQRDQAVREQLHVVQSLRQEERCILGSCLEVLEDTLRQPDQLLSCQPHVDV